MATETNSPATNPSISNSPGGANAASGKKGAIDWSNIFVLSVCTATASIFISIYVLALAWYGLKDNGADPLDRAARAAANDLLSINVFSASFGPLGVADFYNDDLYKDNQLSDTAGSIGSGTSGFVRSYNTAATQVRTAMFIAKRHNLGAMSAAAAADFDELNGLKDNLRTKIIASVYTNGTGKIYEHIKRVLLSNRRGAERLISLKVQVGTVRDIAQSTEIEAEPEDLIGANAAKITSAGKLQALVDLANPDNPVALSLHQQPKSSMIVDSDKFVDVGSRRSALQIWSIPTAIYIDCEFSKPSAPSAKERRTICILVGTDAKKQSANERLIAENTAGCFAVCFPQGKPQNFSSLLSILDYKSWQTGNGQGMQWQQAVEGGVPGAGSLTPPAIPALKAMNPGEALSIVFYHWLRTQPTSLSPSKIERLLATRWEQPTQVKTVEKQNKSSRPAADESDYESNNNLVAEVDAQDNSGLVRESGARIFALNNLSKPTEAGQKALFNCFQASPVKFPPSALPVVVDALGKPNLPGHVGFDRALALSLMSDLYFTNVAAQDSLATAKLIQMSAMRAYKVSKERSFLAQTELDSLSMRHKNERDEKLKEMLAREVTFRNSRIAEEFAEQKKQLRAYSLAQQALLNARTVASQSFQCGAKLYQLTRGGINRLDDQDESGTGGYVLGKRFIFRPLNQALQETEITATATRLAGVATDTAGSASPQPQKDASLSPWLSKNIRVFGKIKSMTPLADTSLMVEGKSLSELLASGPPVKKAQALSIVFSPALLHNEPKPTAQQSQLLYFDEYPFKGLSIPERQLFYYGQNAYQSASVPTGTVNWSVLARDLVANKGLNSNHQKLGLPQTPISTGWYKKAGNWPADGEDSFKAVQNSGGLACEWQLRAPTMLLNVDDATKVDSPESGEVFKGTTLSDPESGQRVPQIPPVNPDLL